MSTARAMTAIGRHVQVWDCVVRRRGSGPGVLDTVSLEVVPVASIVVYTGKAGFGGRRAGQRRDDAFADRREEVGMMRFASDATGVDSIVVDDEIEWSEGPLVGVTWYVIGGMESAWRGTKRIMISRTKQEVAQS